MRSKLLLLVGQRDEETAESWDMILMCVSLLQSLMLLALRLMMPPIDAQNA